MLDEPTYQSYTRTNVRSKVTDGSGDVQRQSDAVDRKPGRRPSAAYMSAITTEAP